MGSFAKVANGRECWNANHSVPRHRHDQAYAAVVLCGSYEECGSRGRFRVTAGDVLVHDTFDAHLDRFQNNGAHIVNLTLDGLRASFGIGRVDDPDAIARVAERDVIEAGAMLRAQLRQSARTTTDWQDILAFDLLNNPDCRLDDWAQRHHLTAETISRGFGKVFGVTPASFRLEVRARQAFAMIAHSRMPLATIAAKAGFADQAHMSRAIRTLTGLPPGHWRRSNSFKTEGQRAA